VPNRLWVADITYLPTWQGFLYLAVIIDAFSRRVVGWSMATYLRTDLVLDALEMALWNRRPAPGVIHHSDHGSQTGFKGSSQQCRQELRCNSTDGGHPIGHNEPECGRQVVRRWHVEKIGNASGRQ
jgi:putative transposase